MSLSQATLETVYVDGITFFWKELDLNWEFHGISELNFQVFHWHPDGYIPVPIDNSGSPGTKQC